ncbi:cell envelope integrity protein TolA [Thermoproteota archaeon]
MKEDKHVKVLQLVKIKGPVIPSQINKEIEVDVMMGSAILSELVDKGQLKISNIKIGSSPLYYASGQESKLLQFISHLNPKDRDTVELLRQKKILKDKNLEPLRRVSLRQIKDFAVPLNVTINNEAILFWKWYLISNEEAGNLIRPMLQKGMPKVQKPQPPVQKKTEETEKPVQKQTEQNQIESVKKEQAKQKQAEMQKQSQEARINADAQNIKKEMQSKLDAPSERGAKPEDKQEQKSIEIPKDRFFRKINKYLEENNISIIDYKINRKESDIELTVKIPSSVGSLTYFCKAKNKKKFNDGDLSSVFIEGQRKKMPILFLVTGDLTKKAKEVLESEFKNMSVKRL